MADLIDRRDAIDALETVGYGFSESDLSEAELEEVCEAVGDIRQDMIARIKRLPSAEPDPSHVARDIATIIENEQDMRVISERKTGQWIYGEDDSGQDGWTCSECGFFVPWYYDYYGLNNIDFIRDFHTCPHCDAKMLTYTGKKMEAKHE